MILPNELRGYVFGDKWIVWTEPRLHGWIYRYWCANGVLR